jgi:hypothetical protein
MNERERAREIVMNERERAREIVMNEREIVAKLLEKYSYSSSLSLEEDKLLVQNVQSAVLQLQDK